MGNSGQVQFASKSSTDLSKLPKTHKTAKLQRNLTEAAILEQKQRAAELDSGDELDGETSRKAAKTPIEHHKRITFNPDQYKKSPVKEEPKKTTQEEIAEKSVDKASKKADDAPGDKGKKNISE